MGYVVCNKECEILNEKKIKMTYFDIVKSLFDNVPANGFSIAEMRKDFSLIDLLNENKEEVTMQDEQIDRIISLLENARFGIFNREFVNMFDYFNSFKNKKL